MGILIILAALSIVAATIWVLYLIAKEFYKVAQAKGHSEKKYLWFCFLLGIVGYLLIVALPDRGNSPADTNDELPNL